MVFFVISFLFIFLLSQILIELKFFSFEQEQNSTLIKLKISLEQRVKEIQSRLDEVDYSSIKGGKRAIKTLEQKVIIVIIKLLKLQ